MRHLFLRYGDPAGETALTPDDGPFAEAEEQLGSVHLVDCADAAAALAPARRMPAGPGPTVEIREILEV